MLLCLAGWVYKINERLVRAISSVILTVTRSVVLCGACIIGTVCVSAYGSHGTLSCSEWKDGLTCFLSTHLLCFLCSVVAKVI